MEIERLLEELEDVIESSWNLPLSGGRAVVNSKELKRILEDIRLNLPEEIIQANRIIENRARIIEETHTEAANIMKASEEKIKAMINKTEIVKQAQATAQSIIFDANSKSKEIKSSANKYVDEIMKRFEDTITSNLSQIRKAHEVLTNQFHKL